MALNSLGLGFVFTAKNFASAKMNKVAASFKALDKTTTKTMSRIESAMGRGATAMGLFAAIPAVIAYNRYAHDVERLSTRYDNFIEEFSAILRRQTPGRSRDG